MRRIVALLVGASAPVCALGVASAQTAPAPSATAEPSWPTSPEQEEDRLGRLLDEGRSSERGQAVALGIGGLVMGAAQIGLGGYMLGQSDVAAQAIGPGLVVGGAVDCLLGIAPLLLPTPMSTLKDSFDADRAAGKPAAQVVSDVEEQWRALVARQRRARIIRGVANLVIGIPAFTTGLVFALAKPGLAGMSSQTQYGWAGGLVGFDFAIYLGIAALLAPPPADTALDTYELLKHGGSSAVTPQVSLIPLPGGAAVGVGVAL